MKDLSIREAVATDSQFAYRVKEAAFKKYVEEIWGWDEDEQRRLHGQRFAAQDFRVISLKGRDIGIMAVVIQPDCMKLNQLFLMPDCQGKGIGRECMLRIIEEARQLGTPIRLRVLKINSGAQAFYQKLSFTQTGEIDTHVLMEMAS